MGAIPRPSRTHRVDVVLRHGGPGTRRGDATDVLAPMLGRPVEQLRPILPTGGAEDCAGKLVAYARAGAQRVFLWPLADEPAQLEAYRERVVPLVREGT